MNHSFCVEVATEYGFAEAVLLENIFFWVEKNKKNKRHFYDGRYWTYNTLDAMAGLFPYLTKSTIHRALKRMAEEGLILKGNYNKSGYDRTVWYSLSDAAEPFFKEKLPYPKMGNGDCQNGTTIPDINTDIKPDNTPLPPKGEGETDFDRFWAVYPRKVAKPQAMRSWKKAATNEKTVKEIMAAVEMAKESADWKKEGGKYIPYPATWLNNRRWEDCLAAGAKPADRLRRFLHENKAGRIEPQGS